MVAVTALFLFVFASGRFFRSSTTQSPPFSSQYEICADKRSECDGWAKKCDCARNLYYMKQMCAQTCGFCAGGNGYVHQLVTNGCYEDDSTARRQKIERELEHRNRTLAPPRVTGVTRVPSLFFEPYPAPQPSSYPTTHQPTLEGNYDPPITYAIKPEYPSEPSLHVVIKPSPKQFDDQLPPKISSTSPPYYPTPQYRPPNELPKPHNNHPNRHGLERTGQLQLGGGITGSIRSRERRPPPPLPTARFQYDYSNYYDNTAYRYADFPYYYDGGEVRGFRSVQEEPSVSYLPVNVLPTVCADSADANSGIDCGMLVGQCLCQVSPQFMLQKCAASCGFCGNSLPQQLLTQMRCSLTNGDQPCMDRSPICAQLAGAAFCTSNAQVMKTICAKTCHFCF